jgi:hypothetical protein
MTTATSRCSTFATTPSSASATGSPAISTHRASTPRATSSRGLWTNYIDTEDRRGKVNVVEDGELERGLRSREQESNINSLTFGGENLIGTTLVIDYRLAWNKSQEETPDQITSTFKQEDVEFDPNVGPDFIDPDNIQSNPLNEDINEFWFDGIESEYKKASEEDIVGAINLTNGFYRDSGFGGLRKFGAKYRAGQGAELRRRRLGVRGRPQHRDFLDDWQSETLIIGGRHDRAVPVSEPDEALFDRCSRASPISRRTSPTSTRPRTPSPPTAWPS